MIIANNKYPNELYVNGTKLSYSNMLRHRDALDYKPEESTEDISLLIGCIYNFTSKLFKFSSGTCITPSEIKELLPKFGYTNVKMYKGSEVDDEMLEAISTMMSEHKPVFISAISGAIDGHSWVISRSKYSGDRYMLYCNWGSENGICDGYFAPNCFNPSKYDFDWHFRVITYDIPTYSSSTSSFYF